MKFDVEGMTCASCAARIERVLQKQEGVASATVNYAGHEAVVTVGPEVDATTLETAIERLGYQRDDMVGSVAL